MSFVRVIFASSYKCSKFPDKLIPTYDLLEESLVSKKRNLPEAAPPKAARKLTLYIRQNDLRLTNTELFSPLQLVTRIFCFIANMRD